MTDKKVKIAVAVEVGKSSRCRPVAMAAQAATLGDIVKRTVTLVMIKRVRAPAGDKEVGVPIVVIIAHGNPVSISAGRLRQTGSYGDIFKRAITLVVIETIALLCR